MPLQTIDKPNLYFSAQLLINNIVSKISESATPNHQIQYHLLELKHVFQENTASATTHLEGIADLATTYVVATNQHPEHRPIPLLHSFAIHAENNTMLIDLNPEAIELVKGQDFQIKAID